MTCVSHSYWSIQTLVRIFLTSSTNSYFYILLLLFIICTNEHKWCSGERSMEIASGLGFESQVPQIFHVFFLFRFRCAPRTKVHHVTSQSSLPSVLRPDPRAITGRTPWGSVNALNGIIESQNGPPCFGPRLNICTPLQIASQAQSLSLPFFLFVLIYLFILCTNKLIISFFIKKSQKYYFS